MAEWRERGYVPDSDDEGSDEEERADYSGKHDEEGRHENSDAELTRESDVDTAEPVTLLADASLPLTSSPLLDPKPAPSDTSRSATDLQHPAAQDQPEPASQLSSEFSTAEKLEAQLASGLQTCRDVLKSRSLTPVLSDLDSPLSSLPSSPEVVASDAEARRALASQSRNNSPSPVPEARQQAIPPSTLHAALTGRSFRPRALMQLHPYTVEYAKYQNDWKARGLPPIRPVDPQLRRQDETQGTTTFNSSQDVASSSRPSSPLTDAMTGDEDEFHSARRPLTPLQLQQAVALDDDLPDLADILKGDARASSTDVARKRKARADQRNKTYPKQLRRFNPLTDEAQVCATEREQGLMFDLPPSPPRSARVFPSSLTTSEDDQLDLNMTTPRPLPTPVLSSDGQISKRDIVEVSSSSTSEIESGSGFSSSSDNEAGGDESQGLMQIRRKIKGVLPASWLRLDAQHQKQPAAHRQYTVSPEKSGPSKGLARHVVVSGRSAHDEDGRLWPPDLGSDGEDSASASDDEYSRSVTSQRFRAQSIPGDDDLFMDGVAVEDEVDAMVPAASRASRQGPRAGKKRQQRLYDGWIVQDQDTYQRNPQFGQPRRPCTGHRTYHKSGHKRRKVKEKHQQLTVLDAPGFVVERNNDVPRFLKIAARVKGSRPGTATQDARQKYFQLSTADDTAEVNNGLRDWTTGTSSRKRSSKSHAKSLTRLRQNSHASRNPQPRSGQTQGVNIPPDSDAQIRKLKTLTNKTLTRLQEQAALGSKSENAVSATEPGQHLSRSRHLGVFFSHVNRSGRGSLLNPTFARVGQLEGPRVSLQFPKKKIIRPHPVLKAVQNQPITGESSLPSQPALPQRALNQR